MFDVIDVFSSYYFSQWQLKENPAQCSIVDEFEFFNAFINTFFLNFQNRRNVSGSSTPSGMRTPGRKASVDQPTASSERKGSRGTTPSGPREPFRL